MTKRALAFGLILLSLAACARGGGGAAGHEVVGLRIGMSRDDAVRRLEQVGRKERDERKQQEVWALKDHPDYTHLLVGFNKEKTEVRYVTAVAKPGRVRYADVVDVQKAKQTDAANNHTYEQEVGARDGRPAYIISARGTDPQHLAYYSLKRYDAAGAEEEGEENKQQ
ncbi:MAG TPA: hypothetical protein VER08_09385 [Pyrinomonadaceae bacterium]|nr:hypothetical protein [Pyrinomonadaceae bacterium]